MRRSNVLLWMTLAALTAQVSVAADAPAWAYGIPPANAPVVPNEKDDGTLRHVSGSTGAFTLTNIRDAFGPADWFPNEHPAMPDIVGKGRKPDVRACGLCHYPNGQGRPENAPVVGYPSSYFIQQLIDFRSGNRKSAEPKKNNTNVMIAIAKGMTEEEMKQAADYYASMQFKQWIRVVEADKVPKTRLSIGLFLPLPGHEMEPLGRRMVEMPENLEAAEVLRDPHSGFVAYVPFGSLKKGEALVTKTNATTTACAVCHGADLRGSGPVPGIAGRSPSYLVRQMYDMQQGARKGQWTELMKPVVAKLTEENMLAIAAYVASLKP